MPEQPMSREQRLANERALYRYHQALARGDIETIAAILQAASHNADLERMIYAMHDVDQPANHSSASPSSNHAQPAHLEQQRAYRQPAHSWPASSEPGQSNHHAKLASPPRTASQARSEPPTRGRTRLQTLAAVLVVLALISGSLLLFQALHTASGPATHVHTPTPTPTPTATVATPQGMVIMLFTNGTIQAVRGVTGQHVWSYTTGVGGLGDVNVPFYNGLSVQNHRVYVLVKNHVFVLSENQGQLLWQKTFPIRFANVTPNDSQLYLDGQILYVAIQGDTEQAAYALRASNGDLLWQATSNAYSGTPFLSASDGIAYIALENGTTYQTTLEARNATNGAVLWSHQYPGEISFATVANHVLYVYAFPGAIPAADTKLDKRLMAFQASNGTLLWSHDVHYGNYTTNIASMQNTLVVDDRQQLCVHSASNGSLLWCTAGSTANPDKNTIIQTSIGSYLAGNDELYVAYIIEKDTLLSPTEVATVCKQQPTCINASLGHMFDAQVTLQVKALDYQRGQTLWTTQATPLRNSFGFFALSLVQLQQNTLLVGGSSSLIITLDASNGHALWHIDGPASPQILQMVATP